VAHHIGSNMCYWVLTKMGTVLARTTVQRVTNDDINTASVKDKMTSFTEDIKTRLDDHNHILSTPPDGLILDDKDDDTNDEPEEETKLEQDNYTKEAYDIYLGTKLLIPCGEAYILGCIIKQSRDQDDNPVGIQHSNPLLDTCQYKVQFRDGSVAEYTANLIAEIIYSQNDTDGR